MKQTLALAAAMIAIPVASVPARRHQDVALKDLVPSGVVIGVAQESRPAGPSASIGR